MAGFAAAGEEQARVRELVATFEGPIACPTSGNSWSSCARGWRWPGL